MLQDLKFVKGAVAKKDYQPALTHFRIKEGQVTGYNGTIALSSPITLDLNATPKAIPFVKAIERCGDTTTLSLTPSGKLFVKSGRFKAYVECTDESEILDGIIPEGEDIQLDAFLPALHVLAPFIGTDASRPWAMGILLRGHSAYATNNIILAEYWVGADMPDINLPASAIVELTRIGEEPTGVRLGENSVTFFFEGNRWLRSQLLNTDWPDIGELLNTATAGTDPQPFPEGFFDAVDTLLPFVEDEGRIYFREGRISTAPQGDSGASINIEGLPDYGAYNHKMIGLLRDHVSKIDFNTHPKPCPFYGKKLRGVFLGMRDD